MNECSSYAEVLRRVFANYDQQLKGGRKDANDDDDWTSQGIGCQLVEKIEAAFTDSDACLICLESIAVTDAVWHCGFCYELYHLHCVQQWSLQALNASEYREEKQVEWHCPKCRCSYTAQDRPARYECFCGKVVNPKFDAWITPHSCGEICERSLGCQHDCLLQCHPGPCPPCPKIVRTKCYCGKGAEQARRCGKQGWACGKACGKILNCGVHTCEQLCHEGGCSVCERIVQKRCNCGRESKSIPCSDGEWTCQNQCNKSLLCGKHRCEVICHEGECPPCVRPGSDACPCGKQRYGSADCRDLLPCCGDTCSKLLQCQMHQCVEKCHRGPCPTCMQECVKKCRCGARTKAVVCGKEFLCDIKCRQPRQCGRHPCSRKCCDGRCPPCEQTCNRPLNCKTHKCSSPCHTGPCYPCAIVAEVTCACGSTKVRVPCGFVKKTRPPRCKHLCRKPPDCHHPKRADHLCHFGDCPPCKLTCAKSHKACGHSCPMPCHDAVLLDVNAPSKDFVPATPLDKPTPKFEQRSLPCPSCRVMVEKSCRGGHEVGQFPCCELRSYSCGRECGRILTCGNHHCKKTCHEVTRSDPCEECSSMCTLPRPEGCPHICPNLCHPPPCKPCRQMLKHSCHCSLNPIFVPCKEWVAMRGADREGALCCGNPCPKLMPCGHTCTKTCHLGACADATTCKKKVEQKCKCGGRSRKGACGKVFGEQLECDAECKAAKKAAAVEKQASVESVDDEHVAENEQLESKEKSGRRYRKNKKDRRLTDDENVPLWKRYYVLASVAVSVVGFIFWLILSNGGQ